ncbi:protein kinase [Frigoribacterium sp. UYMn621]|uniref:protein kinase domain-containing protein n=1 Tax=Frigoribacterium sp. UYMn621 TaxID=3156343 RepID=UPI00339B8341
MTQGYGLTVGLCSLTPATGRNLATAQTESSQRMPRRLDTRSMETVGGYRLVRKLGEGTRAEIHLGHAGSREPPDGDRIAAIKIYRPQTDDGSIDREIEALARVSSRHLLELKDLATGPDGRPCLILPRLGSGTLSRLLALRGTIAPGEAVSILVPLVEAVKELHRVGVAHRDVALSSVLFDDRGAPVLAKFGSVALIGEFPTAGDAPSVTPAELDEDADAVADRQGIRILIGSVLDRLEPGASAAALSEIRRELEGPPPGEEALSGMIDLLFALAPGLPIRFDEELPVSAPLPPSMRPVVRPIPQREAPWEDLAEDREILPNWASAIEVTDIHPLAQLRARLLTLLAPVRIPVWIAGGAGVGALVVALTVIPAAHSETTAERTGVTPGVSQSSSTPSTTKSPTSDSPGPASNSPAADRQGPTASGSPTGRPLGASPAPSRSAIEGEDPLAAARALLAARSKCFVARSVPCLDSVDQAGSAVIEADRDLVRRLKNAGSLPAEATLEGFTPHLIQQLGDSAIIQLLATDGSAVSTKNPAPLLLVRSEAGWRIRDLSLG